MKIKSNILYDLLDQNTGEQVTYVKTTTGYDGTVITSENEAEYVDGVIYKKLKATDGGGYAKRVAPGGYGFIEWFVGDDLSNGVANLDAVIKLSRAGLKVKLNRGVYPLECATNTTVNTDTQPLFIEGDGEKNTKVILKTQHSKTGGTWLRGYFTASRDITLKNLTLSTQSFEDGVLDQIESEYRFCTMYKPNKIKIYTPNCTFNGSISFVFQHNTYSSTSTEAEVISQYVDSVDSPNCTFNYVSKLFMFRNCYVNKLNFTDGFVNNLLGFVASAGYTEYGNLNKLVIWDNMHLNNTIIPVLTDWYHCPLVLRCHTVYYQNSSVKNLINKNKTSYPNAGGDIKGAETYALYASAEYLHFNNNDISNVLGQKEDQHDNCMFKVKGADNVYARGNKITLEKQALVDAGVLETIDSAYSTIDKNEFIYAMFGSARIEVRPEGEFIFKNNKIRVPYINKESYLPFGRVDISDNEWEIDYVATRRDDDDVQVLFYNHRTGETLLLPGISSDLNRNKFKVNAVEDSAKPLYVFGEESPIYASLDKTSFSSYYSISNNDFIIDGIDIILGAARAPRLLYNDNEVIGTGSIQIDRIGSILADNIPFANISQKIKCSGPSLFQSIRPLLWGNSEFNIYDNTHDVVVVMQTGLNDWFYNNYVSNSTPILISFNIEYINSFGVLESARYLFAQTSTNQLKYLDKTTGLITNFDPRTNTNSGIIEIQEKTGKEPEVSMFMERLDTRRCSFYFSGLSNISDYKLTSRVEGKAVNPVTFYDEWLAIDTSPLIEINQTLSDLEENKADKTFATTTTKGLIKAADIPVDSTAEDISTLVADFNNLLQRLRDQNTE